MNAVFLVLRPDDAARLAGIHARCFADAWSAAAIRGMLSDRKSLAIGIEEGGEIRAFILGQSVAGETDILTIATDPDHRRRGYAGALIAALIRRAGERGIGRITLDVAEDNSAALSLYKSHGFSEDGRRPRYYAAGRSKPVDAILMSRQLEIDG